MKDLNRFKEFSSLVKKTKKAFDIVCNEQVKYMLDNVERYIEGLFSFAKFKEGDTVQLKKAHKFDHGWNIHNPTFTKGAIAVIRNVNWRKDTGFTYDLVFDKEYYEGSHTGIVHVVTRGHAIFSNWSEKHLKLVKTDHIIN